MMTAGHVLLVHHCLYSAGAAIVGRPRMGELPTRIEHVIACMSLLLLSV